MKIEYFQDKKNEWRFRIIAKNGRIVADSGESYKNKKDCIQTAEKILQGNVKSDELKERFDKWNADVSGEG